MILVTHKWEKVLLMYQRRIDVQALQKVLLDDKNILI